MSALPYLLLLAHIPFVLLDPGHGGVDPGAVQGRVHEQTINLAISRLVVRDLSRQRVSALILRQDEGDSPGPPQPLNGHQKLELSRRAALTNRLSPDLFVSVHANAGPSAAHGPIVFLGKSPAVGTERTAWEVERRLVAVVGGTPRVVTEDFYLLRNVHAPGLLVETGFLTNAHDRALLTDPAGQRRVAQAIADGIVVGLRPGTQSRDTRS